MPSTPGDLTLLCRSLSSADALRGVAKVLPGKNALARGGSPVRIVMFPVTAINGAAENRYDSVSSAWMLVTAHFWARDDDNAFDLRTRWFQALRAQADAGGYFWRSPDGENERWDTEPDTAEQGQEFEVDILIRIDANLPARSRGTVEATSMTRAVRLEADLAADDVVATVVSTHELPSNGTLQIDDELISYSGTTPTTFTGLTRGLGGTTPAAHDAGALVYVSPA